MKKPWLRGVGMAALAVMVALPARAAEGEQTRRVEQILTGTAGSHTPGVAILVRQNGKTVFERARGVKELKSGAPLGVHTDFRLASCTKQFTAMAVMLLVHDGKLRYDQPLTEIFPEFPAYGNAITVRDLLHHTSGLPDYETLMDEAMKTAGPGAPARWFAERQIQDAEVLQLLAAQSQGRFAPGSRWSYSNSGYVVLGLVVAKISGEPFRQFLQDRIFAPLKMEHTLAYQRGINEVPERAYGHSRQPSDKSGAKNGAGFVETDQSSTSATLGDGGVYSNLEDLAKWDDAITRNTLLSAREMQAAWVPVRLADGSLPRWESGPGDDDPQAGKPVAYGFGWFLDPYQGHRRMWHYGDTTGFKAAIVRFPDERLTVIVLCNRADLDGLSLASKVANVFLPARKAGTAGTAQLAERTLRTLSGVLP